MKSINNINYARKILYKDNNKHIKNEEIETKKDEIKNSLKKKYKNNSY